MQSNNNIWPSIFASKWEWPAVCTTGLTQIFLSNKSNLMKTNLSAMQIRIISGIKIRIISGIKIRILSGMKTRIFPE